MITTPFFLVIVAKMPISIQHVLNVVIVVLLNCKNLFLWHFLTMVLWCNLKDAVCISKLHNTRRLMPAKLSTYTKANYTASIYTPATYILLISICYIYAVVAPIYMFVFIPCHIFYCRLF